LTGFLLYAVDSIVLNDIRSHEDIWNRFGISWPRVAGAEFSHSLKRSQFTSSGRFFDFSSPDSYALRSVFVHFELFHLEEQTLEPMTSPNKSMEAASRHAFPLVAEREFEHAFSAPARLSAAVAHVGR
jgi:hypothetical protein